MKKRLVSYDSLLKMPLVSTIRQREKKIIHKELHRHIKSGETVLEIGCGSGYYTREILKITREITCLEESPAMIEQLNRQLEFLKEKISTIVVGRYPEAAPQNNFDHVVAISVLDYIEDPKEFLDAALRNARKSIIFTAMGEYPLNRLGIFTAKKLFKIHVFPHSEDEISESLKPYSMQTQKISVFKPAPYTTLICTVKKS